MFHLAVHRLLEFDIQRNVFIPQPTAKFRASNVSSASNVEFQMCFKCASCASNIEFQVLQMLRQVVCCQLHRIRYGFEEKIEPSPVYRSIAHYHSQWKEIITRTVRFQWFSRHKLMLPSHTSQLIILYGKDLGRQGNNKQWQYCKLYLEKGCKLEKRNPLTNYTTIAMYVTHRNFVNFAKC